MLFNRFYTQSYEIFITQDAICKNVATLHNRSKRNRGGNMATKIDLKNWFYFKKNRNYKINTKVKYSRVYVFKLYANVYMYILLQHIDCPMLKIYIRVI